jgi:hypothetical protein
MRTLLTLIIISFNQLLFAGQFENCEDPKYIEYVNKRHDFYYKIDKEQYEKTKEELKTKPFAKMSNREQRRFLYSNNELSARFDSKEQALFFIEKYEKHTNALGKFFSISKDMDMLHKTNIARAWLALKVGDKEEAVTFLLKAAQVSSTPVLGSFGPDKTLIRELYKQGEKEAVLEYLERVSAFWNTDSALEYIELWQKMIKRNCLIQFQFYDTTSTKSFDLD